LRLTIFEQSGSRRLGIRSGNRIIDVVAAGLSAPADISLVLREGPSTMAALRKLAADAPSSSVLKASELHFKPLTVTAGKTICLGLNYVDHAKESGFSKPEYPTVFLRAATSFVGHGEPILKTPLSDSLDYEGELVAFIGRQGHSIRIEDALAYVAGYSVFNDASVREYQVKTTQWTMGKNFDGTGAFGPDFVSADELPPGAAGLSIQTRLNKQVVQNANTSDMIFGVAESIALLSQCCTLEPGDVLVMGTPSGVGNARNPKLFMRHGDTCEVEIERVGLLSNPIMDES
jgi:acylpyruvate hydrolase